jgi:hypothetical protein
VAENKIVLIVLRGIGQGVSYKSILNTKYQSPVRGRLWMNVHNPH